MYVYIVQYYVAKILFSGTSTEIESYREIQPSK